MPALGRSVGRAAPPGSAPELQVTAVFKDNLADFFFPSKILKYLKKDSTVKVSRFGELLS